MYSIWHYCRPLHMELDISCVRPSGTELHLNMLPGIGALIRSHLGTMEIIKDNIREHIGERENGQQTLQPPNETLFRKLSMPVKDRKEQYV